MGLPRLETCCFLLDLKTGNIIMGSINAVLSFVMFVMTVVLICNFESFEHFIMGSPVGTDSDAVISAAIVFVILIMLCLTFLAKFGFDVLFVYGVLKERAGIIRAYFILWVVFLLLSIWILYLNGPDYSAGYICTELFYIGVNIYILLLSYSFYKQLSNREEVKFQL